MTVRSSPARHSTLHQALASCFFLTHCDRRAITALIYFDAVLMERVICNLLENAIKYSTPGTPILLEVALQPERLDVAITNQGA